PRIATGHRRRPAGARHRRAPGRSGDGVPRGPRRLRRRPGRADACGARPDRARSRTRGLVAGGLRRLLQDLHARRLPGRALSARDTTAALPVPPVVLRCPPRRQARLRSGRRGPPPTSTRARRRRLPARNRRFLRTRRPLLLEADMSGRWRAQLTATLVLFTTFFVACSKRSP